MLKKVQAFVEKYNMINRGDGIVLGVSGGADSVSLFYVMLELKKIYDLKLAVVHVNHGIRGKDADCDEEFVKKLCERYAISFTAVRKHVKEEARIKKLSEEEAGRQIRYEAFSEAMTKFHCQKTAVAHNKNDLSETVLLNLIRGTGIKGLTGIEPVRGNIIRPLLCVERSEIENYLTGLGIQYQNDISNQQDKYTRNKIRLNVLPYIKENVNQQVVSHVANTAAMLMDVNHYIDAETEKIFRYIVKKESMEYSFFIEEFKSIHPVIQAGLLRKILFELSGHQKDIELAHINMILDITAKNAGKRVDLPYGLECISRYGRTVIRKKICRDAEAGEGVKIIKPGSYDIQGYGLSIDFDIIELSEENRADVENLCINTKNDYTKVFDYDKIKNAVLVRNRKPGDFFQCNALGNMKKLKEFFINEKVPSEKRGQILLLSDGNHIIWIIGFRISEYYKINDSTKRILYVKVNGGKRHD